MMSACLVGPKRSPLKHICSTEEGPGAPGTMSSGVLLPASCSDVLPLPMDASERVALGKFSASRSRLDILSP